MSPPQDLLFLLFYLFIIFNLLYTECMTKSVEGCLMVRLSFESMFTDWRVNMNQLLLKSVLEDILSYWHFEQVFILCLHSFVRVQGCCLQDPLSLKLLTVFMLLKCTEWQSKNNEVFINLYFFLIKSFGCIKLVLHIISILSGKKYHYCPPYEHWLKVNHSSRYCWNKGWTYNFIGVWHWCIETKFMLRQCCVCSICAWYLFLKKKEKKSILLAW